MKEKKILFNEDEIARRVAELAKEIDAFYGSKKIMAIALLNGGTFFACDLLKKMKTPLVFDTVRISSYVHNKSTDKLVSSIDLKNDPKGKNVLLIDDILDSGRTLDFCRKKLIERGAKDVRTCVFLKKRLPEELVKARMTPDWHGFEVENCFVAGYGLDSEEFFRNCPYVFYVN